MCHVRHRKLFDVPQHNDFPQQRRNATDLFGEELVYLTAAELSLRVRLPGRHVAGATVLRNASLQVQKPCSPLLPDQHEALVHKNGRKPRCEIDFAVKLIEVAERLPVGVLRFIFGISLVPQNEVGKIYAPGVVAFHELAKSLVVSVLGQVD